ncbi:CemA-like proton extrusion protein-related [Zea mays]|uniref:CemA-like proton extrusion protein-related n=1 Tax=Zea mays TaxID=4577 RepID=A0A1D6PLL3_MAIZE|nr:CemA-like proton extrusion protein-related [Zea mays]AQL10098.1 CemA-like proton extrusion protein-related [Zea mays]
MKPPVSRAAFASVLIGPRTLGASLVAARCASSSAAAAVTAYGEKIVSPGAKRGLIPCVVPLSESPAGDLTSLLRWPTAPTGMEMPVVEVRKHGLWLLAKNVKQYIHRILVEADFSAGTGDDLWAAVGEAGKNLYAKGEFKESQVADLDVYLLKKVGLFPDVIERKTLRHLEKGDNEAAELAGWEDEQLEFIREKVTEEGKREDLKRGKAPEQVILDEAAFLMDLASVDGNWDEVVDRIAECYREAGLHDIANFIAYRE